MWLSSLVGILPNYGPPDEAIGISLAKTSAFGVPTPGKSQMKNSLIHASALGPGSACRKRPAMSGHRGILWHY